MTPEVIVFGCGSLGLEVAEQLNMLNHKLLLVSNNSEKVECALSRGLDATKLDYTDDDALRSVGIGGEVKNIFCLFQEDSENVFLTLSARALAPQLKIVCAAESGLSHSKLMAAGANKIIDPYEISARHVHDLISRPLMVDMMEHTIFGEHLDMAEIEVARDSSLSGLRISQLDFSRSFNLILLGIVDRELGDNMMFTLGGPDNVLDPGDILVLIGPGEEITRFRADLDAGRVEGLLIESAE